MCTLRSLALTKKSCNKISNSRVQVSRLLFIVTMDTMSIKINLRACEFINLECLSISWTNIYLKYYSTLVYVKLADQLDELFFLSKPFKHFSLMIRYGYDVFLFCADNFLVLFYDVCCILRFLYFLSFLVQLCFDNIAGGYGINQLFFYFFFSESFCPFGFFTTSPQL